MDVKDKIIDIPKTVEQKKLELALEALERIQYIGDAEWKKQRAREAIYEIKRIK